MIRTLTRLLLVAVAIATSPVANATEQDTRTYIFSLGGKQAGTRTITRVDDNTWKYHFEFSDRGRGPDLVATLETDGAGIPLKLDVSGKSYFKGEVDEHFIVHDGNAEWRNENEAGHADAGGFYVPFNDASGSEPLLRALLNDEDHRIELLPSGIATIKAVHEHPVTIDGNQTVVTLYAIEGLGFSPEYAWATPSREVIYDGWAIRKGLEHLADELDAMEARVKSARYAALVDELVQSGERDLLVRNAAIFDPADGSVRDAVDILVRNGKIVSVSAAGETTGTDDLHVIDAAGRFVMPGLYDMHVHNFGGDGSGLQHLAGGVTTVRDLAAPIEPLLALRDRWHSGETLGPRIHMAGFIDGTGKYAGPSKTLVDTRKEALDAVRKYADNGYVQIKLYNSIPHELLPVIIEAAHERGMKVSGHIPVHLFAEEAVEAGYDEIQHINHLFLNFMAREIDNRTPARFTEVGEHGAELDLRSESVQEFIRFLKRNNTVIDPTLAIFESSWVSRPGDILEPRKPVADRLPPMVLRQSLWSGLPVPEELDERYVQSFRQAQAFVKELYDAGVPIVAGTDFMPGFALHRELELYSEAGIPNADVLRIATLGAAEIMGEADRYGRVAPGYSADFILVDGNPLRNISDIRKVSHVIRDGKLIAISDMQSVLGMTSPASR